MINLDEATLRLAREAIADVESAMLAARRQLAYGAQLYAAAGLTQGDIRTMLQPFLAEQNNLEANSDDRAAFRADQPSGLVPEPDARGADSDTASFNHQKYQGSPCQ
jgi:hypothetical protein